MNAPKTTIKEYIEWTNMRWNNAPDAEKPRALLIGDSIVNGHSDLVFNLVKDKLCIDYLATAKCVSDVDFRTELDYMLGLNNYAMILFNNGLHGWDIDETVYAENLRETLVYLKTKTGLTAWRNSTPIRVVGDLSSFEAVKNTRVIKRNADAEKIAAELGLPVLDLYTPMAANPGFFCDDAVHYNEPGRKFQAEAVAVFILKTMKL
ncbi:MAG: SGNH/GDSL hydrolase family protein [Victivallaceae bacterium]